MWIDGNQAKETIEEIFEIVRIESRKEDKEEKLKTKMGKLENEAKENWRSKRGSGWKRLVREVGMRKLL